MTFGQPLFLIALRRNLCAASLCLFLASRKSAVFPSLSTALYKYGHRLGAIPVLAEEEIGGMDGAEDQELQAICFANVSFSNGKEGSDSCNSLGKSSRRM